jgi:hypothetical protein
MTVATMEVGFRAGAKLTDAAAADPAHATIV